MSDKQTKVTLRVEDANSAQTTEAAGRNTREAFSSFAERLPPPIKGIVVEHRPGVHLLHTATGAHPINHSALGQLPGHPEERLSLVDNNSPTNSPPGEFGAKKFRNPDDFSGGTEATYLSREREGDPPNVS